MRDRGARRLFFYLHVTAVTAPGLTRLVKAETAYRAAIRVVQTSAEIEPYLVAVIARSGAFESFSGHGFPGHRLFFVNSFPRNLYLSDGREAQRIHGAFAPLTPAPIPRIQDARRC